MSQILEFLRYFLVFLHKNKDCDFSSEQIRRGIPNEGYNIIMFWKSNQCSAQKYTQKPQLT